MHSATELTACIHFLIIVTAPSQEQCVKEGVQLTDIFVRKFVAQTNPLGLVLDRPPIDNRNLELLNDGLVD